MKIEFNETDWSGEFTLIPETVAEMAKLARFSRNAAAKKPDIFFEFRTDVPHCYISIYKRKKTAQINSVSPKTK